MRTRIASIACLAATAAFVAFAPARAQAPGEPNSPAVASVPYKAPPSGSRYQVFVSDLHFGVGRAPDGTWDPTEDFRWPNALAGFLDRISRDGQERVDLVIVGDLLEMWQPPPSIPCKGLTADLGCTLDEMESLSRLIVAAHAKDFDILRAFSERGENRVHLIPGNHDATLRYERVWRPVGDALNATSGRIDLVDGGIWNSPDGRVVAEHGHQIGLDVNRYENWPQVVRGVNQVQYVIRPWGELFVQKLFNEQERTYEIIDNLSPETAGARYRAADRGIWNSSVDVARFIFFNLWETSLVQRDTMLGPAAAEKKEWNVEVGRKMGASLFLNGLPREDGLRQQIQAGGGEADGIKAELDAMARNPSRLPDEGVLHLCDLIAERAKADSEAHIPLCLEQNLGSAAQSVLISKAKVMARHLRGRLRQFPGMEIFVYGHTHQFEPPWQVAVDDLTKVTVVNTGAFQRLIDEEHFLARLNGRSPQEGLRTMKLEELPACYTAVIVANGQSGPKVFAWHMDEHGAGEFVSADKCQSL